MAGIYIHIPFCKQACHYCNFHFSTTFEKYRDRMIDSIQKELELKADQLKGEKIQTLYFGGGTPSLLSELELQSIVNAVQSHYDLEQLTEFTLEVNPDDVNLKNINAWKMNGVNRISLGVQSFFADDLEQMNRAHTSSQAHEAIQLLRDSGLTNISIDFMFALPLLSNEQLAANLVYAIEYKIPHISCYNLTIEEQTALAKLIQKGKIDKLSEDKSVEQFQIIMDKLGSNRYHQYEISNYALEGYQSKHNSSYWAQKPYLGIGPSAHSFIQSKRSHNIANNTQYMDGVEKGSNYFEVEELSEKDFFNEYVLTRLRTSKGIPEKDLEILFPKFMNEFREGTGEFIRKGYMAYFGDEYRLMPKGKFMADYIASELFQV